MTQRLLCCFWGAFLQLLFSFDLVKSKEYPSKCRKHSVLGIIDNYSKMYATVLTIFRKVFGVIEDQVLDGS